jgi:hypothetical protein
VLLLISQVQSPRPVKVAKTEPGTTATAVTTTPVPGLLPGTIPPSALAPQALYNTATLSYTAPLVKPEQQNLNTLLSQALAPTGSQLPSTPGAVAPSAAGALSLDALFESANQLTPETKALIMNFMSGRQTVVRLRLL